MGLFGALFAGVSGLDSQSNKIGAISNNIANSNTVGYKQTQADFDTLVVPSGTTSFSPGGVIGNTQNLVNQQGLIQATSSPTDVAISGNGLLVVNTAASGTGSTYFTRAGSFTQDATGNFVNANGFYLQGFPLDANGNPPTNENFASLKTVNVSQSATGSATATSLVTLAANLNATQTILLGSGETAAINPEDNTNASNSADVIITPTAANGLARGDTLNITTDGTISDTFTYGGFAQGRDVTATVNGVTTSGDGDGGNTLDTETVSNAISTDGTDASVTITVAHPADYTVGQSIYISGAATVGNIAASNLNGSRVITAVNTTTGKVTFTAGAADSGGTPTTNAGGTAVTVTNRSYPFTGNILDATTPTSPFFNTTSSSLFTASALTFQIATNGTTSTFTYSAEPSGKGEFNSLSTLASTISNTPGLTASVVNGRLYVSALDADQNVTFVNGDTTGNSATGQLGLNWTQELDLTDVAKASTTAPAVHRFNSLNSLATTINTTDPTNIVATVNNPLGTSTVSINSANAQQTILFADGSGNAGSLVKEFSFVTAAGGNPSLVSGSSYTTGTLPIKYSATNAASDMSSGAVPAQFTKDITIYDALGNSHTIGMNVAKLGVNEWAIELTAVPATDVISANGDGQIASGIITFNGDGTLNKVTGTISNTIPISWTNGSIASAINLNLGTSGKSNGLTQSASDFNVSVANQNGSAVGELTGVSIDANGFVIAAFSNGQTQKMFQVPLASVNNPNGLESVSGDAYTQTLASGVANLQLANTNGVGTFSPSALEQSNVDLSTQLTDLIVAQQAYGANSKVLTIADQLLQELDQIIQ